MENSEGKRDNVRSRALTEEHARDSFENLLFSVCRFRELTGTYPQNITVSPYTFPVLYEVQKLKLTEHGK